MARLAHCTCTRPSLYKHKTLHSFLITYKGLTLSIHSSLHSNTIQNRFRSIPFNFLFLKNKPVTSLPHNDLPSLFLVAPRYFTLFPHKPLLKISAFIRSLRTLYSKTPSPMPWSFYLVSEEEDVIFW